MTHQSFTQAEAAPIEAGRQVAHLRHVATLAAEIAGREAGGGTGYDMLDEAARISAAYDGSSTLVQRRFDALAEETLTWAAAAIEALLAAQQQTGEPPRAAAGQLVRELEATLRNLKRIVRA